MSLAPIVVFDVGGPLVAYYSLRAAGLSALSALLLSGVLPACGLVLSAVRRRRLDAVGILVLLAAAAAHGGGATRPARPA